MLDKFCTVSITFSLSESCSPHIVSQHERGSRLEQCFITGVGTGKSFDSDTSKVNVGLTSGARKVSDLEDSSMKRNLLGERLVPDGQR